MRYSSWVATPSELKVLRCQAYRVGTLANQGGFAVEVFEEDFERGPVSDMDVQLVDAAIEVAQRSYPQYAKAASFPWSTLTTFRQFPTKTVIEDNVDGLTIALYAIAQLGGAKDVCPTYKATIPGVDLHPQPVPPETIFPTPPTPGAESQDTSKIWKIVGIVAAGVVVTTVLGVILWKAK